MPRILRLIVPAVGGLLAGAILQFGTRLRGHVATTDYMEAVVLGDGKIAARRTLLKCLSSLFTIASGGSIGREGPLVQLSALAASLPAGSENGPLHACDYSLAAAQLRGSPRLTMLPLPALCLSPRSCWALWPWKFSVLSFFPRVIATLTVRAFLGTDPLYAIPAFRLNHSWEIVPYLLLGLTAGLLAPWFIRLLRLSEEWAGRIAAPVYIKMCVGG